MAPRGLETVTIEEMRDGGLRLSASFHFDEVVELPERISDAEHLKGFLVDILNANAEQGYSVNGPVHAVYRPLSGEYISIEPLMPNVDFNLPDLAA